MKKILYLLFTATLVLASVGGYASASSFSTHHSNFGSSTSSKSVTRKVTTSQTNIGQSTVSQSGSSISDSNLFVSPLSGGLINDLESKILSK